VVQRQSRELGDCGIYAEWFWRTRLYVGGMGPDLGILQCQTYSRGDVGNTNAAILEEAPGSQNQARKSGAQLERCAQEIRGDAKISQLKCSEGCLKQSSVLSRWAFRLEDRRGQRTHDIEEKGSFRPQRKKPYMGDRRMVEKLQSRSRLLD